jgi:predicted DNA binding CopG/RHH family protein
MINQVNPYNTQLSSEEQEWLTSFEAGEWETVDNIEDAKLLARQAATNYLRKDARINIRISSIMPPIK